MWHAFWSAGQRYISVVRQTISVLAGQHCINIVHLSTARLSMHPWLASIATALNGRADSNCPCPVGWPAPCQCRLPGHVWVTVDPWADQHWLAEHIPTWQYCRLNCQVSSIVPEFGEQVLIVVSPLAGQDNANILWLSTFQLMLVGQHCANVIWLLSIPIILYHKSASLMWMWALVQSSSIGHCSLGRAGFAGWIQFENSTWVLLGVPNQKTQINLVLKKGTTKCFQSLSQSSHELPHSKQTVYIYSRRCILVGWALFYLANGTIFVFMVLVLCNLRAFLNSHFLLIPCWHRDVLPHSGSI